MKYACLCLINSALQRQSAVTTHLVKNELRLVMGFMMCVLSCEKNIGVKL